MEGTTPSAPSQGGFRRLGPRVVSILRTFIISTAVVAGILALSVSANDLNALANIMKIEGLDLGPNATAVLTEIVDTVKGLGTHVLVGVGGAAGGAGAMARRSRKTS